MERQAGGIRASPSMAVAIGALVVALGGTSIAASKVLLAPANSVNSAAVIDHSLMREGFQDRPIASRSARSQGPAGPAGPVGATGAAGAAGAAGAPGQNGTAKAYAYVDGAGVMDPARSFNVTSAAPAAATVDCFVLPFTPKNVIASIQGYEGGGVNNFGSVSVGLGVGPSCLAGTNAYIATVLQSGTFTRLPVYMMFN